MGNPQLKFGPSTDGPDVPLRQGEILSGIVQLETDISSLTGIDIRDATLVRNNINATTIPTEHPFVIVVSNECDLEQDFNNKPGSKYKENQVLPNVLLCEIMDAYKFEHDPNYEDILDKKSDSTRKRMFRQNKDVRFHFIEAVPPEFDSKKEGLPALAVIFKRHFTLPARTVYRQIELNWADRRTILTGEYAKDLCDRFHHFNGRVALPEQFDSRKPKRFVPQLPADST